MDEIINNEATTPQGEWFVPNKFKDPAQEQLTDSREYLEKLGFILLKEDGNFYEVNRPTKKWWMAQAVINAGDKTVEEERLKTVPVHSPEAPEGSPTFLIVNNKGEAAYIVEPVPKS